MYIGDDFFTLKQVSLGNQGKSTYYNCHLQLQWPLFSTLPLNKIYEKPNKKKYIFAFVSYWYFGGINPILLEQHSCFCSLSLHWEMSVLRSDADIRFFFC